MTSIRNIPISSNPIQSLLDIRHCQTLLLITGWLTWLPPATTTRWQHHTKTRPSNMSLLTFHSDAQKKHKTQGDRWQIFSFTLGCFLKEGSGHTQLGKTHLFCSRVRSDKERKYPEVDKTHIPVPRTDKKRRLLGRKPTHKVCLPKCLSVMRVQNITERSPSRCWAPVGYGPQG